MRSSSLARRPVSAERPEQPATPAGRAAASTLGALPSAGEEALSTKAAVARLWRAGWRPHEISRELGLTAGQVAGIATLLELRGPHHRPWFKPPHALTIRTGLSTPLRALLKRMAWTGPVRATEVPHPGRLVRLLGFGLVREDERGLLTLSAAGLETLAALDATPDAAA